MKNAHQELARRVARFDSEPDDWLDLRPGPADNPLVDLYHFVDVMERITETTVTADLGTCIPADADTFLGRSRLLARLADNVPEIVTGPISLDAQVWTSTGKASATSAPDVARFVDVADAVEIGLDTKPFWVGLFTSTGVLGVRGMWRIFLELGSEATLHPRPWYTWAAKIQPDTAVLEIASASDWVRFVDEHPLQSGRLIFPDWRAVAQRYDAVHMTLRAIAAVQGLRFVGRHGELAPTFWDVESTFWLHWRFRSMQLVEVIASDVKPPTDTDETPGG